MKKPPGKRRKPPSVWVAYVQHEGTVGEVEADGRDAALRKAKRRWPGRPNLAVAHKPGMEKIRRKNEMKALARLKPNAYHEAGHAIFALALHRGVRVVTTHPTSFDLGGRFDIYSDSMGRVEFKPLPKSVQLYSGRYRDEAEREIMIALAGPMAQFRHAGRKQWKRVAGTDRQVVEGLATMHAGGFGECISRYIEWLIARTAFLMDLYWPKIEAAAVALIERRELTGRELETLVKDIRPGMPTDEANVRDDRLSPKPHPARTVRAR